MDTDSRPPSTSPPHLLPWQVHPSLTEERLQVVDSLIREARHEAVLLHEPSRGDTPWVLGCRAFQWSCHRIAQAAFGPHASWLRIIEGGERIEESEEFVLRRHFVFSVGEVPIRFYRGIPEEVPARYLRCRHPELRALQMALFEGERELDEVFRIAVETDDLGEVERTALVQVEKQNGTPHRVWPIEPRGRSGAVVSQFTPKREEERKLERPTVLRRDRRKDEPTGTEPGE